MTEQNEVKEANKRIFLPESTVKANITNSIKFVLEHPSLNPENYNYIVRMREKHKNNKRLTSNEVAGLTKIEETLRAVDKGTYKKD